MPTLYLETSIIGYMRNRPSSQIVAAARQLLTQRWWDLERLNYELVASQYVVDESAAGDADLAGERLELLRGIPLLPLDTQIETIAGEIVKRLILPATALVDALHIATAAWRRLSHDVEL